MLAQAVPPPALPAVKVHSAWVASARTTRVAALSLSGVRAGARADLLPGDLVFFQDPTGYSTSAPAARRGPRPPARGSSKDRQSSR
jgi:hypothetical protein